MTTMFTSPQQGKPANGGSASAAKQADNALPVRSPFFRNAAIWKETYAGEGLVTCPGYEEGWSRMTFLIDEARKALRKVPQNQKIKVLSIGEVAGVTLRRLGLTIRNPLLFSLDAADVFEEAVSPKGETVSLLRKGAIAHYPLTEDPAVASSLKDDMRDRKGFAEGFHRAFAFRVERAGFETLMVGYDENKKQLPSHRHMRALAEQLPFKDETFDFIFSSFTLSYCDKELMMKELMRVLKKGAGAVIIDHVPNSSFVRDRDLGGAAFGEDGNLEIESIRSIAHVLALAEPFPTLEDGISFFKGLGIRTFTCKVLYDEDKRTPLGYGFALVKQ